MAHDCGWAPIEYVGKSVWGWEYVVTSMDQPELSHFMWKPIQFKGGEHVEILLITASCYL